MNRQQKVIRSVVFYYVVCYVQLKHNTISNIFTHPEKKHNNIQWHFNYVCVLKLKVKLVLQWSLLFCMIYDSTGRNVDN